MKLNIDANASRPGGASTKSSRRSRSKLGQAMSEAWGALGKRKSEPDEPDPEALARAARAQEQLARAKGILQLDRTLTAAERAIAEPVPSSAGVQIAEWIAAEIEGVRDGATPLDPASFAENSGVARVVQPAEQPAEPLARAEAAAAVAGQDAGERAVLEILSSGELPAVDVAAPGPLQSAEIATSADEVAEAIDALDRQSVPGEQEPIRTRTMARLLVSHGYLSRALTIYEHLLAEQSGDDGLRAEVEGVRAALAQKTA